MTIVAQAAQQFDNTTLLIWVGVIAAIAVVKLLLSLEART